jgi:hypothetical protein
MPRIVRVTKPTVIGLDPRKPEDIDHDPFLLRPRSDEEKGDYDLGFQCGSNGGEPDETKSKAWQRGWAEAQE